MKLPRSSGSEDFSPAIIGIFYHSILAAVNEFYYITLSIKMPLIGTASAADNGAIGRSDLALCVMPQASGNMACLVMFLSGKTAPCKRYILKNY